MDHPCSAPVPDGDPLIRDRSVTRSLATRNDYILIGASVIFGASAASAAFPLGFLPITLPFHLDLGEHALRLALPIAVLPLLLMLVLIGGVLTPWRAQLEHAWLAALPFPFAQRGYLTALKREPTNHALELLLVFDHQPAQEEFAALANRRVPSSKLVWQDDRTVLVRSPPQAAARGGYSRGMYNNAKLHQWFRKTAAPFLIDLHRKAGLQKVELRT